jgi:hypothetical protein
MAKNAGKKGAGRSFYRDGLKKINLANDLNYRQIADNIKNFVRGYWLENGYSPSMDEIASECGYHRTSAYYWVHRMREKGDLLFEDKVPRSIRLPGQVVTFPDENRV